jgi:hypothetical protein
MRRLAPLLFVAIALSSAAAGCRVGTGEVRAGGGRDVFPELVPGHDTPDEVRAKWGEPARVFTFHDKATGHEEVIWQYEERRAGEAVGARQVVFREGCVHRVERLEGERPPRAFDRPDSASRRDMSP